MLLQEPDEYPLDDIPMPYRYQIRDGGGLKRSRRCSNGRESICDESFQLKKSKVVGDDLKLVDEISSGTGSVSNVTGTGAGTGVGVGVAGSSSNVVDSGILHEEDALPLSPIPSPSCRVEVPLDFEDASGASGACSNELYLESQTQLPASCFKNLMFRMIAKMNRKELTDICTLIKDNLKRDFISCLPLEVSLNILKNLSYEDLVSCLRVSKNWNKLINTTPSIWKQMLLSEDFVSSDNFDKYSSKLLAKYPDRSTEEDCYRIDFLHNRRILNNWYNSEFTPKRYTLKGHTASVVTCLQFEDEYIITGADDKMIRVYDSVDKRFLLELSGHEGGVWALKYDEDGIIVSGSTDRSVRVWDIKQGRCTHIFKGHTSTVRCLEIVEYKNVKYIITGSRDNTLHVWKLPKPDVERRVDSADGNKLPFTYNSPDENPYFVGILRGHMASVRALSGHGNIVISGSYDNSLMVWDIAQMKCLYILTGHTDRIYSTVYDHKRKRCISASMDATIRVWDLKDIWRNGTCTRVMNSLTPCTNIMGSVMILHGHTALVGLLKLSDKFLVSAAADGSLRGWNAENYSRKFLYHHVNMSAITTFDVDDNLLISGSESQFNIYNLRTGATIHPHILRDADQIWSVRFKENILVVAVERDGQSFIEIFDFNINNPSSKPPKLPELPTTAHN
ncbi:hypothetical protein Kpol_1058p31 [Vanderwaltozyma polyspora DSM 70294]|uniref:F-box domain-containing protein n=1 Tax=Vanderwaltozyma polyspora (strain ATCC 22028 / DSM 70294 / BCRC 21397 / CBS 2163 / NBRC 10782 / NRRL Y-8283 / UCD 57-17) TaxID=436907 RepID=A7TJR5_VANPO|nr:uncharacterized protein Kpol_1058p31 [Vanderwaltozyma polyspora DSM 70294]EDO17494.1 hypothetical protein Kpol_1058p31 [Vanderwaltozyma polyspora DSM 70294]